MIHIVYHAFGSSPKELSASINEAGVECRSIRLQGRKIKTKDGDLLVNWGCPFFVETTSPCRSLNNFKKMDKFDQLTAANVTGRVRTPYFFRPGGYDITARPGEVFFVRTLRGHAGGGITIVRSDETGGTQVHCPDGHFVTKYIPKIAEFRAFCGDGLGRVVRKKPLNEDSAASPIWSWGEGFAMRVVKNKLQNETILNLANAARVAIGMDFAAVDVIMDGFGTLFFLEANSAPGLRTLDRLAIFRDYLIAKHNETWNMEDNHAKPETAE